MPYQIITEEGFEASHIVSGHPKCGNLHGHTWKLVVCLEALELPEEREFDFVRDFGDVKAVLREIVPDHKHLNDHFPFVPTSENLARFFWMVLSEQFPELAWVEVWEGLKNHCRYWESLPERTLRRKRDYKSREVPLLGDDDPLIRSLQESR